MKNKIIGLLFLFITLIIIAFIGVGMHGQFMFRPHMLQDWILWGSALSSLIISLYFFFKKLI